MYYSSEPARDWDRYQDHLAKIEQPARKTADDELAEVFASDHSLCEWVIEYALANFYTTAQMRPYKEAGKWTAKHQADHERAGRIVKAIRGVLCANGDAGLLEQAKVFQSELYAALEDQAKFFAEWQS